MTTKKNTTKNGGNKMKDIIAKLAAYYWDIEELSAEGIPIEEIIDCDENCLYMANGDTITAEGRAK